MKNFLFATVLLTSIGCFFTTATMAADDIEHAAIKKTLSEIMPGQTGYKITRLPASGIYEVDFGEGFMYLTADGKYAIKGDIIDLQSNINLTEVKRLNARLETLASIDAESMLIYPADKERKYSVTVFTDIDCGYCRRMHNGIKEYTSRGIEVKYVFYPQAGRKSASFDKAVSVWCADDRHVAMDKIMSGQTIAAGTCKNPIEEHMKVAAIMGVSGTPLVFLQNGKRLPGYVQAAKLQYIIEKQPSYYLD